MQGQRGIQERAASREALDRFVGARDVRLNRFFDSPGKLLGRAIGGFFEAGSDAGVVLFDEVLGFAMQFAAAFRRRIIESRAKCRDSLLLRVLEGNRMLFEL